MRIHARKLRERLGFSQDTVAHALGVAGSTIHRFETGERDLSSGLLEDLADFYSKELHITVDIRELNRAATAEEAQELGLR